MQIIAMDFPTRSLSSQESRVVLALTEQGRRDATRAEIIRLLGGSPKAVDHIIQALRKKGLAGTGDLGEVSPRTS